jgi:hypothetical protein
VAFGTEAFRGLATLQAKAMGMPDLPVVLIPHPLGGIPVEQALAKAHNVVDEVATCVRERMAAGTDGKK